MQDHNTTDPPKRPERPICVQCPYYEFRRPRHLGGWEAYCTARSTKGRLIVGQYSHSSDWARKELKDKMHSLVCPGWCPEWRKGE